MKDFREKLSGALTQGAHKGAVVGRSLLLGLLATLFTLPYFHFLIFSTHRPEEAFPAVNPWKLLAGQASLLFLICVLSVMVGLSFAARLGLPGLGNVRATALEWKRFALIGFVLGAVSFITFDQWFVRIAPAAYPVDLAVLLSLPFKMALTEEIILRLCMVTLAVGVFRIKWAGVLAVALAAPFLAFKSIRFFGLEEISGALVVVHLLLSFAANLVLGIIFITHGLFSCLIVKFAFALKYFVVAWIAP